MKSKGKLTPERIMQFAWGYAPTLAIEAAVRHGYFGLIGKGPRTVAEVARATKTSQRGARAVLDVLVAMGLLKRKNQKHSLTPESAAFLVPGKPTYHGTFFGHISDQLLPSWLQLTEVVRTGKPALKVNDQKQGAEFFAEFVEAIFPLSFPAANALGAHLGIPKLKEKLNVLDIGAGSGVWGIALAKQSPHVHVRAVDWPPVLKVTKKVAAQHGVGNRFTTSAGDFFKADFGEGHGVATVGHILHSEGRDRSRRLIKKIYDALAPGGTIAIQEFVPNEDRSGPPNAVIFAMNMLVNTEAGDTFTFAEMREWLLKAGFEKPRLLDVPAVSPLVLANKPRRK